MEARLVTLSVSDASRVMSEWESHELEHRALCAPGSLCLYPRTIRAFQSSDDPSHVIVLIEGEWTADNVAAMFACPNWAAIMQHDDVDWDHERHHIGDFTEIWTASFS